MSDTDDFPVARPPEAEPEPEVSEAVLKRRAYQRAYAKRKRAEAKGGGGGKKKKPLSEKQLAQRRAASKSSRANVPSGGEPDKTEDELRSEARDSIRRWRAELGTVMLTVAPIPATYVLRTDDEVIEAAVRLAGKNARWMAALAGGSDILAALVLLRWTAGLGVSVAVQYQQVAPDASIAVNLGVTNIVSDLVADGTLNVVAEDGTPVVVDDVASDDVGSHADDRPGIYGPPTPIVAAVP